MPLLLETVGPRAGSAPLTYTITEPGTFDLQSVFAHFVGTGASGSFRPVVTIKAQDGTILARVFPSDTLAAGDTADVTYAPFLRDTDAVTAADVSAGATRAAASPQLMGSGVYTAVAFTTEEYDTDGIYSAAQPTRFTPQRDGFYQVSAYVYWAAVAGADYREIYLQEFTTGRLIVDSKMSTPGKPMGHAITGTFRFLNAPATGEYVRCIVVQNSGGNLAVNSINVSWNIAYLSSL